MLTFPIKQKSGPRIFRAFSKSTASASSEPLQNAHQSPIRVKVYYPLHPRAGEDLLVVGFRSHRGERCIVITDPDGNRELIPEWMTKSKNKNLSLVSTPCLSIEALQNLRFLINSAIIIPPDNDAKNVRRDNEEKKGASTTNNLE